MPLDTQIFGQGIYTPRQAARLIGAAPQDVLRWTRGSGATEPLWHAHYREIDNATEVSFADLIELRVVRALRRAGVSLQAIRFAISYAAMKFGSAYPLTTLDFKTDGQEILISALEKDGELVSLSRKHPGQKVFSKIINQSLNDLEYEDGGVSLWRPYFSSEVVIDPTRTFGSPIIDKVGISTGAIAEAYKIYGNVAHVSKIYEIPIELVKAALRYEERLDANISKTHGKSAV